MPQGPRTSFGGFRLTPYRTPKCLSAAEPPGFDFSMELITGSPHLGTHFDGLAHVQSFGKVHGGHAARDVFDDFGWRANGLEHAAPVVGRGVLLDVPATLGVDCLPDRYEITPDDLGRTPMCRPGHPAELVGTCLLLVSDAGSFITGQTIFVDGGFVAGGRWFTPDE